MKINKFKTAEKLKPGDRVYTVRLGSDEFGSWKITFDYIDVTETKHKSNYVYITGHQNSDPAIIGTVRMPPYTAGYSEDCIAEYRFSDFELYKSFISDTLQERLSKILMKVVEEANKLSLKC